MLLYTDIITGDELGSDAFPIKLVDEIVYEIDGKMITVKEGDVDIGANASAEEAAEVLEDGAKQVINVVHSFRLQQTTFKKPDYITHIKAYMKAVKAKLQESNPDRIKDFEDKAAVFVKKILTNFKDYDFYTGDSMNPDGMVVLVNYREDGVTPYFTIWKDGLKEVKL